MSWDHVQGTDGIDVFLEMSEIPLAYYQDCNFFDK